MENKKVVVITGGNSGLGEATAKILSPEHQVVILGKNVAEIKKVSKELNCDSVICDITKSSQIKDAVEEIVKKQGKIDCLINCAGVWIKGPVDENTSEEIERAVSVNVLGTFLVANALVPQLKKQKHGRIINISSRAGLNAKAGRAVYNATKWAVTGFTKCLQLELAPHNISVVGFYPGFIHTDLFEKAGDVKENFNMAMSVEKPAKALAYLVNADDDLLINSFEMESLKESK